jgi:hypothetical protein
VLLRSVATQFDRSDHQRHSLRSENRSGAL